MRVFITVDDFKEIFLFTFLFLGIYILFFKNYIYSILDPLLSYLVSLSFSSVLVMNTLALTRPVYADHFFICHFFLFVGYFLVSYKFRAKKIESSMLSIKYPDYHSFKVVLYIVLGLYFLSNVILFLTTGFALLADDPSRAKVENPQVGYAILYQINAGVGSFLLTGLLFLLLYKPKIVDILTLVFVVILSSLSGAKGALVQVGVIMGLIVNQNIFRRSSKVRLITKAVTPILLTIMVSVPFIVYGKESGSSEQALVNFVTRLLMSADSTLYFYQPVNEQYFAQFHFWDYPIYLFNSTLDFLRIRKGIPAHGDTMLRNVINNYNAIASGPNTPYYIEGQIYFGYYGAFIYSAVVGAVFAYSRYYFFNKKFFSIFSFVITACITNQLSVILGEVTMGFFNAFLTYFFVLPIYFFVKFIVQNKGRIKIRKRSFNWLQSYKVNNINSLK